MREKGWYGEQNQRQKHNSRNKEKKERQLVQKPEVTPGKHVTCLIVVV
jgi:hypothetical protein